MCGIVLSSWQSYKATQQKDREKDRERGTFVDLMYLHKMT